MGTTAKQAAQQATESDVTRTMRGAALAAELFVEGKMDLDGLRFYVAAFKRAQDVRAAKAGVR